VDETHGIGGMAHFLLPQPVSLGGAFQPEKYASTGLPLFLKALCETGARPERLKATIAGGALVGPVGALDISLNIGGRTADIAQALLQQEGIALARVDTGGMSGTRLSLDMRTLSCSVAASDPVFEEAPAPVPLPETAEIDQGLERLLPIPQVALKIMQLADAQQEVDLRILTGEIRKDQVLSARTLQLANSVMFASRNRIDSLEHALMYLGVNLLMRYVVTAAVDGFFDQPSRGYSLCKGGLFHHAVGTAVVAEKLAHLTGRANPALAYTAGLLHDIGKVALDQLLSRAAPQFYRRLSEDQALDFTQAEREVFGLDHAEIGLRLAQRWSLPDSLAESIRHHHVPERALQQPALAHIVFLANFLMSCFRAGLQLGKLNAALLAPRLAAIGLACGQLEQVVDLIPMQVFDTSPEKALQA
jgi:putative nucleotidyltransferase with HDIG domain